MRETEEELTDIKREIIESRGLAIKTNNLTSALAADVRGIAKRQQGYERKISWNSATAYVVFVLVMFSALKVAWDARVDQITAKTEAQAQENDRLRKEVKELQKREEDRAAAEVRAAQFYELVRQGKRADVIDMYEQLKKEPLSRTESRVFGDAVLRARNELSSQLYIQALEKAKLQRWQESANLFEQALKHQDESSFSAEVRIGLADAYRHLNRQRDAIPILQMLVETPLNKEVQDDALYMLAHCQTEVQAWNDAKETWRMLIRKFPDSRFTAEGKIRLEALNILH